MGADNCDRLRIGKGSPPSAVELPIIRTIPSSRVARSRKPEPLFEGRRPFRHAGPGSGEGDLLTVDEIALSRSKKRHELGQFGLLAEPLRRHMSVQIGFDLDIVLEQVARIVEFAVQEL